MTFPFFQNEISVFAGIGSVFQSCISCTNNSCALVLYVFAENMGSSPRQILEEIISFSSLFFFFVFLSVSFQKHEGYRHSSFIGECIEMALLEKPGSLRQFSCLDCGCDRCLTVQSPINFSN